MKQTDKISFIIGCVLGFVIWLTAINWTEPYVYDLKDYVDPSECTVRGCVRTIEGTKGPNNDVNFLGETTYYDLVIEDTEWRPPEPVCQ